MSNESKSILKQNIPNIDNEKKITIGSTNIKYIPLTSDEIAARTNINTKTLREDYNNSSSLQSKYPGQQEYIETYYPNLNDVDEITNQSNFDPKILNDALKKSGIRTKSPNELEKTPRRFRRNNRPDQSEKNLSDILTIQLLVDRQLSLFESDFNKIVGNYPNLPKLNNTELMTIIKKLYNKLNADNKSPKINIPGKIEVQDDLSPELIHSSIENAKKTIIAYEYNLIGNVFKILNNFYRSTFYDELVSIKQPRFYYVIIGNNLNKQAIQRERADEITNARDNLRSALSNSDELTKEQERKNYRQICFDYGTKQDLENAQIETGININDIKPYKQGIKAAFINLLSGLLDNYPIDIDITQSIRLAAINNKEKEKDYIYGYTVILRMKYGVLEDNKCQLAIPDGGFDEIGKQMKNQTRIKQIREERSICKHGDTITASFSKWFKGGSRKTRKLNKNKLKRKKTKRYRSKKQRKTHKRR